MDSILPVSTDSFEPQAPVNIRAPEGVRQQAHLGKLVAKVTAVITAQQHKHPPQSRHAKKAPGAFPKPFLSSLHDLSAQN